MQQTGQHIDFYLVGIGNHPTPPLSDSTVQLMSRHTVFSGGKRHYQLVKQYLPATHHWIEISGAMPALMEQYQSIDQSIVVFVSGDPFFYGFGNTLMRLLPDASIQSFPYFNSIQVLCHRTQTNYNTLKTVSVHGRDWSALDQALIKDEPLIGVLTDTTNNPASIASRVLQYGFDHYAMIVGENLDGADENIIGLPLTEVTNTSFAALNCVLLSRQQPKSKPFGLRDEDFIPLQNRPNMITKMAIRLNTIHVCALDQATTFWDIGSCTGSVAIEAKRHYPHLNIVAFEKRAVCQEIIQGNMERFSTPGIAVIIDDFFELDLSQLPVPEVIFIGGHGNRLAEMIQKLYQINPKVRMITNAVQDTSTSVFIQELEALHYTIETTTITIDSHNEIKVLAATTASQQPNSTKDI